MSILGNRILGGAGQQPYTVSRSLRFRSSASAYLNRTFSAGNQQKWTWSGWVKRGALGAYQALFGQGTGTGANGYGFIRFDNNDVFTISASPNGATSSIVWTSTPVYRDPSAWYHVVAVLDTTQATAANRFILYVNAVSQSGSFSTTPTQNANIEINRAAAHQIGVINAVALSNYFDGYLAEVNFIDGQALTPSSFGAYDNNGVWQPRKYGGTYGTNGFYLPFSPSSSGFSSYYGNFNGTSQYLSVTNNAALNPGTGDYTVEAWVYLNNSTNNYSIFEGAQNGITFGMNGGKFAVGQSFVAFNVTDANNAPLNQWVHVAASRSGTTLRLFVNGVQVGSATNSSNLVTSTINYIGYSGSQYLPGYISNFRLVKGTAVYTSNFTPPSAPLTAISGTSLLTLQNATIVDNSTNAFTITNTGSVTTTLGTIGTYNIIANDASGNGNNWTPNNISLTAGTTYDSMIDSPTVSASSSNYCVFNPIQPQSNVTFSEGNLKATHTTNQTVDTTMAVSSGKWYFELTVGAIGTRVEVGLAKSYNWAVEYLSTGTKTVNGVNTAYGATWTTGDIIGCAFDLDGSTATFYKNGVSQGQITGIVYYSDLNFPTTYGNGTPNYYLNFGQRPFSYTPPTGYNSFNTQNLPQPTIMNGAKYMAATTYTGNGSSLAVANSANNTTGVVFQPDFAWIKSRSNAYSNQLVDSVRGSNLVLSSDGTAAEQNWNTVTSLNSNGITVATTGGLNGTNGSGSTFVGWQWNAGSGVTSTNTNGSITSLVSVNPTAGFSIVSYTGTGVNATVGHGLGVVPNMVIIKNRTVGTENWAVYHTSTGAGNWLLLSGTNAAIANTTIWQNTTPTSSVISLGPISNSNVAGSSFIGYFWSAVAGYSAFGSYTGNGSADGPFIYTGFRPRWLMIKRTDIAESWVIEDSSRDTYNVDTKYLLANLSDAEGSTTLRDLLSNGFKFRSVSQNASGSTYIYAAFAENPFKVSRAR